MALSPWQKSQDEPTHTIVIQVEYATASGEAFKALMNSDISEQDKADAIIAVCGTNIAEFSEHFTNTREHKNHNIRQLMNKLSIVMDMEIDNG